MIVTEKTFDLADYDNGGALSTFIQSSKVRFCKKETQAGASAGRDKDLPTIVRCVRVRAVNRRGESPWS